MHTQKDHFFIIVMVLLFFMHNRVKYLCRSIGGIQAPSAWRGNLNITYRIGPDTQQTHWYITMLHLGDLYEIN